MENSQKNTNVLYIIIALLLFILVLETGALLLYKMKGRYCPLKGKSQPAEQIKKEQAPASPAAPQAPADSYYPRPLHHRASSARQFTPANTGADSADGAFEAMQRLQDRMNHLFDTALLYGPPAVNHLMSGDEEFHFAPAIDLQDAGSNYIVKSDLPGLDKSKINITVTGNILNIEGERENMEEKKDEKTGFVTQERSYGSFSRSVTLPGPVDDSKIAADYKNGVLTITLPTAPEKSKQKVAVQ
jgi:HSP20 family protein